MEMFLEPCKSWSWRKGQEWGLNTSDLCTPSSSIYFNFISRTISVHEIVSCGRQTAWGTFTECEGGKNLVLEES